MNIYTTIWRKSSFVLFLVVAASSAFGQRIEVRGVIGAASFPDESIDWHVLGGGALRIYLSSKLAVQPEVIYAYRDSFDKDVLVVPSLVYEFGNPAAKRRAIPYFIAGFGFIHRIRPFGSNNFWSAGAGFGVKTYVTERMFISPEVRLGWEPFIRFSAAVGYTF